MIIIFIEKYARIGRKENHTIKIDKNDLATTYTVCTFISHPPQAPNFFSHPSWSVTILKSYSNVKGEPFSVHSCDIKGLLEINKKNSLFKLIFHLSEYFHSPTTSKKEKSSKYFWVDAVIMLK